MAVSRWERRPRVFYWADPDPEGLTQVLAPLSPAAQPRGCWRTHGPAQHQLGVLGHVLGHQVTEQGAQDVSEILQLSMQRHGEQRRHVGAVPGRESALALQGVDELAPGRGDNGWAGRADSETEGLRRGRTGGLGGSLPTPGGSGWRGQRGWHLGQEELAVEQVGQLPQPLLHGGAPALRHAQVPMQGRLLVPREEDPLGIHLVVEEGDAAAQKVTGEVGHLGHQVCGAEEAGVGAEPRRRKQAGSGALGRGA